MSGRVWRYFLVAVFSWLGICLGTAASDPATSAFDAANKLYEQTKFTEAASAYEQLLKSGQSSAAVYFNLGNAYFKAGQMGKAIEAYARAEAITPRDPDVRANLQFARNQVQGPTYSPPHWKRWLGRLSLNEWSFLACAVVWLWFVLLTLLQWRPSLKPALRVYTIVLGMAVALVCSLLLVTWSEHRSAQGAVVISKEASVRQGPLDESQTTFTLHDGAEVLVLDHKDDWLQISTDPRRIGWVKREQVVRAPNI
jgi:tetratricopeptide (TPR) repeat protein